MYPEFNEKEIVHIHEMRAIYGSVKDPKGIDCRMLRVRSGWLYNFWDNDIQDYSKEWVFVPTSM